MIDTIKIYWKLILAGIITLAVLINIIILSVQLQSSNKKVEKAEIELIEKQAEMDNFIEKAKQKEFERNMRQSDIIIEEQLKKHEELKESIKNPSIDFTNVVIQDSINSKYNRRFIED